MLYYLAHGFSLLLCWGLLLLDSAKPGLLGVFIALIYTFYSSFYIRAFIEKETFKLKIIKFISPTFYLLLFSYTQVFNLYYFINPIFIAFLIFGITSFFKNGLPKKEVQFFVIAFIYLYSFSLYNIWDNSVRMRIKYNSYNFETEDRALNKKIPNLFHYRFLNSSLDSISLGKNEKYTIIETWNEKCPPCFSAIKEMAFFYDSLKLSVNQYYVYIPRKKNTNFNYNDVFSFDKINNKEKILIDINLQEDAYLDSYPVFLVFNKKGELVFSQIGYQSSHKQVLEKEILSVIKN